MTLKSKANLRKTTKGNLRESKKMGTNKSKKNSFRSNKNKGKNQKRLSKSKKRYSKSNQKGGGLVDNSNLIAWGNYSSMFSNIVNAALGKNMDAVSGFEVGQFDVSNYEEQKREKYKGRTWYKFPVTRKDLNTRQDLKKCIWVLAPIKELQATNEHVSFQDFIKELQATNEHVSFQDFIDRTNQKGGKDPRLARERALDKWLESYVRNDKDFEKYLRENLGNQEILIRKPVQGELGGDPNKYYIGSLIDDYYVGEYNMWDPREAYYDKNEERFKNFPNPNDLVIGKDFETEIDILKWQLIESSSS